MSLDLAQPSSLPLNPCLEAGPGAGERRTELGWPEELASAGQQLGNVTLSPP